MSDCYDSDYLLICRDDAYVRFWQRNRPGDREELDGNSIATLRSRIFDHKVNDEMNWFGLIMIDILISSLNYLENGMNLFLLWISD